MCKGTLVVSLRPGIIRESVVAVQKGFLEWFIEVFVGGGGHWKGLQKGLEQGYSRDLKMDFQKACCRRACRRERS